MRARGLVGIKRAAPTAAGYEQVWRTRLHDLARARGATVARGDLADAVASVLDLGRRTDVWQGLYALSGRIPRTEVVVEVGRMGRFHGSAPFLEALAELTTAASSRRTVRLLVNGTVVDVSHTATRKFHTGIQRVARQTARRWHRDHECELVGWTHDFDALRPLTAGETDNILGTERTHDEAEKPEVRDRTVMVPLSGTYLSVELSADPPCVDRLRSLARHADLRTGLIGFDCVPITCSETTTPGMPAAFAAYLTAVAHVDRVATISGAARDEYAGWRRILGGAGLGGPDIRVVPLPAELPGAVDEQGAAQLLEMTPLPTVMAVGSFEPRKNHLAVLRAADTLWTEGVQFSLVFVGSRGWSSEHFEREVRRLQDSSRPVATVTKVSDAVLAGAFRLCRFTVFPSLNEGYGLPAAESLAVGTPVITSNYGSMHEIAEAGGAVQVDPRDVDGLTEAMRRLLLEDAVIAELRDEALHRPVRTWDHYAQELWAYLTDQEPNERSAAQSSTTTPGG